MIQPRFETLAETQLVGLSITMSIAENKTGELWSAFMPRLREVTNVSNSNKFSLQIYPTDYFKSFDPTNEFIKWAAVAVDHLENIPEGMSALHLKGGKYAIFDYVGSSQDPSVFQYIYSKWLPESEYRSDSCS